MGIIMQYQYTSAGKVTLGPGPKGRNVVIAKSWGAPQIIKDGVSVAKDIEQAGGNQFHMPSTLTFQQETSIDLHVISGREEARLIYLGVASGLHLGKQRALFIDIGGGSTELVVGDQQEYAYLDSLKLGAMRLTAKFIDDPAASVSAATYAKIQAHVRSAAIRSLQHLRDYPFDLIVGSSGTIEALAAVAVRALRKDETNRELELTSVQTHLTGVKKAFGCAVELRENTESGDKRGFVRQGEFIATSCVEK